VRVAVAGRFVAWDRDWSWSKRPDLHDDALVVYDRARGRVAYRVEIARKPRLTGISSLAVQSDGKVAAQLHRDGRTCSIPQLVWSEPSPAPRLRVFPARPEPGFSSDVKLARELVMFARSARRGCSSYASDLVVASLDSSAMRVLAHYDLRDNPQAYLGPSFDFDGRSSVYSEGVLFRDPDRGWTSILLDRTA
jgi:hypothetical protein